MGRHPLRDTTTSEGVCVSRACFEQGDAIQRNTYIIIIRITNGNPNPPTKQKFVSSLQIWNFLNTAGKSRYRLRRSSTPSCTPTVVRTHAVPQARHTGGRLLYQSPGDCDIVCRLDARAPSEWRGHEWQAAA